MSQKQLFRSFAGGEITPEAIGRLDLAKYQTGLALAKNFIVLPHGPAKRRHGLKYINEARDSTLAVRLIPFQFSATQSVVVELGNLYARFFIDGAALLESNKTCSVSGATVTCTSHGYTTNEDVFIGGRFLRVASTTTNTFTMVDRWGVATNPPAGATTCARVYQIATPYTADKLFGLHYAQDSDVITLTHPEFAARELRRLGAASWALTTVSFTPSMTVPTGLTVTPTIGTAGNESPQSYVITAIDADGITESLPCAAESTSNNLAVSGNYNTITWDDMGAFAYNVYKARGGAYGFIGQTSDLSIVDDNVLPDTTKTPPQDIYELNTGAGKYPTAVTYHEQRRWFAGTTNEPQTVWATRNGTESNLTTSTPSQDDDGLKFRVRARQQNAIRHLVPLSDLIALTVGGEFRIFSDGAPAITPSTLSTKSQGSQGASDVQPVTTSGSILYMEATGNRVREMAFQWQNEKFASIDISIMAPHLFDGYTIVDMAFQRSPVPICWCVRSDGVLLGMTYVPEQQVYGWHQHHTQGAVESICVVVEYGEDALYLLVRREINGRTVRYVERLMGDYVLQDSESSAVVPVDPHYAETILILNCQQPNGSPTFIDTSPYGNSVTADGGMVITDQFAVFDGVDDDLAVAIGPEWDIGSDDLTVEVVADLESLPSLWTLITNRSPSSGSPDSGFVLLGNSVGQVQGVVWGAPVGPSAVVIVNILSSAGTVTTGLHHFCLQRSGSSWTLAYDGIPVGTATSSAAMGPSSFNVQIGNDLSASGRHFRGGLRVRVTRGVARYTFPFVPDFSPWPDPT